MQHWNGAGGDTPRTRTGGTTFDWNVGREWIPLYPIKLSACRAVQFVVQLLLLRIRTTNVARRLYSLRCNWYRSPEWERLVRDSVDTVRDIVVAATEEDGWNIDTVRNVIVDVVDENSWNIDTDCDTTIQCYLR